MSGIVWFALSVMTLVVVGIGLNIGHLLFGSSFHEEEPVSLMTTMSARCPTTAWVTELFADGTPKKVAYVTRKDHCRSAKVVQVNAYGWVKLARRENIFWRRLSA